LIHLYTYRGDLVLDPFMGSGTTGVAALRTERHYVGYDTDADYVDDAKRRLAKERERLAGMTSPGEELARVVLPGIPESAPNDEDFQSRAVREGRAARDLARMVLEQCGFVDVVADVRFPEGVEVNFEARDQAGGRWFFDVSGGFTSNRPGLRRTDTLWKALGKAAVLHEIHPKVPLVLLTTDAPTPGSAGESALRVVWGRNKPIADVVELLSSAGQQRLRTYSSGQSARART
jgi:hypothetical protein